MAVKVLDGPLPGLGRSEAAFDAVVVLPEVEKAAGKWCEIAAYKTPQSARSCAAYYRRACDDRFEFASRTVDGKGVLYARLRTEAKA